MENDNCIVDCERLIAHTPIFEIISSKPVSAGFRPVRIVSKDWVSIVVEKDGKFLMVNQLRYGLMNEYEEFPCGMVEIGEHPVKAALRELEEETGIHICGVVTPENVKFLGRFAANPAFMSNYMHFFYVNLDEVNYTQNEISFDEHECLSSYWVDKNKAFENFLESEGSSIMGCGWMLLKKEGIV